MIAAGCQCRPAVTVVSWPFGILPASAIGAIVVEKSGVIFLKLPLLIVVSGPPGGGKTTVGRAIAREFNIPIISKDDIKESLFESIGWGDRAWSKKLGVGSIALIFVFVARLLESGISVIAESNFQPDFDIAHFEELKRRYDFNILQVHCRADNDLLVSRFFSRAGTAGRHPGHVEIANRAEFEHYLATGHWEPLPIGGTVIDVDTSDWNKVVMGDIFTAVRTMLPEAVS
jgi:predicted kinase